MSYTKLTPEQKADVVALNAKGSKAAEIIEQIKKQYNLDLKVNTLYRILQQAGVPSKRGRKGKRGKRALTSGDAKSAAAEIVNLVERLDRANEAIFKYLRISLIKKLAEKHQAMAKESIAVTAGDEITPDEAAL